jgi:hypothetical protein
MLEQTSGDGEVRESLNARLAIDETQSGCKDSGVEGLSRQDRRVAVRTVNGAELVSCSRHFFFFFEYSRTPTAAYTCSPRRLFSTRTK